MSETTIDQVFEIAIEHHRAGRLSQAEVLYRQILAREPGNGAAMHCLGVIALGVGRNDVAINLIRRAIAGNFDRPEAHNNLGNALSESGQFDEAIAAYRRAIALAPESTEAHNNLGIVLEKQGRLEEAMSAYRRAIAINPQLPEAHHNLGIVLKDLGKLDEGIEEYRRAIALRPEYVEVHNNLGVALSQRGDFHGAIGAFDRAISLRANYAEAHNNRGSALKSIGQIDAAIDAYSRAVAIKPNFADAHHSLGGAWRDKRELEKLAAAYRRAIALRQDHAEDYYQLGVVLKASGRVDEAIASYRRAITLKPEYAEPHNGLGNALTDKEQLEEAIAAYRTANLLKPGSAEFLYNLAIALNDTGRTDEALDTYRRAIALSPDWPELHHSFARALLVRGEFKEGWKEYEGRWKCPDFGSPVRNFTQPIWDGSDLTGRTILLHAEQGAGDTIQFVRFVPRVAQRGGRVILEAAPQLLPLFWQIPGVEQCIAIGAPLPHFDVHCPLLSLPLIFGVTLENIRADVPYLFANPHLLEVWGKRLGAGATEMKIGLNWAGNPNFTNDRRRSISLEQLAPLAGIANVVFYSLQKGAASPQAHHPPAGLKLINLSGYLNDYADTAAAMNVMDLIITTDTSVAHLAGALGRPVWVMLQHVPAWCWLLNRSDSPWYPTMRLFRQSQPGDWAGVISQVVQAIATQRGE